MPKKFSKVRSVVERRRRVIKRLETQLTNGTKPGTLRQNRPSVQGGPLTAKDKERIKKELDTLNSRI